MKPNSALCFVVFFSAFSILSQAKDYSDAPSSYGTKSTDNGPSHGVVPNLFMGNLGPDDEPDGLPDIAALGDDLDNLDDEDALVNSSLIFLEGESYKLVVNCTNQTGSPAKLGVWVDWNRDGVFKTDAAEFAIADVPSAGLSQDIVVNLPPVPVGVVEGNPDGELSFIRLRLSTDLLALKSPYGTALDGEVEDWQIQIFENYDHGDLPDLGPGTGPGNHRTKLSDSGPRHRMGRPVFLGQNVDGEPNAQPNVLAQGDDFTGINDEDGVTSSNVVPGLTANFTVSATNLTADGAVVRAEVDLNQNGSFSDPGESQAQPVLPGSSDLPIEFAFPIPPNLTPGTALATRFRISTDPLLVTNPDQATLHDGEVEDHLFEITAGLDWGDLPDRCPGTRAGNFDRGGFLPDYQTLAIDNGPSHVIVPGLAIINDSGSPDVDIDADPDGQPTPSADGDDNDGNHDDLDLWGGLSEQIFVAHALGTDHSKLNLEFVISHAVENTTGTDATFYAFFDANRDGDFDDPGESYTTIIPGDTPLGSINAEFDAVVPWPGLLEWTESFALRCRLSTDPTLGPNGTAPDGEVQDDIITVSLSIDNPRPFLADPDANWEIIQLQGDPVTVPLGVPFSPLLESFLPPEVAAPQNPLWSLLLHGDVIAGGAINFSANTISQLGLGAHPVTLTFEDVENNDLYVIRFLLNIVDLPGYSDWVASSNLPASYNRPEQDYDADGSPNLLEFALGTRGNLPGDLPSTPLNTEAAPAFLSMSYPRLVGGRSTAEGYRIGDLLYREQASLDLANWAEATSVIALPPDLPILPETHQWTSFRMNNRIPDHQRGFLRLKIEIQCEEHAP